MELSHLHVDSDDEIESRTGVDIAFIFEKEGEAGFRKREAKVIDELKIADSLQSQAGWLSRLPGRSSVSVRFRVFGLIAASLLAPVAGRLCSACCCLGRLPCVRLLR